MLRDYLLRFVRLSIVPFVGPSHFTFFRVIAVFGLSTFAQMTSDWGSRISDLAQ